MAKILIIDDESGLRMDVGDWLRFEGYDVFGAENALVGIALSIQLLPDLIICDIMMPDFSGFDVLMALRSNESTMSIPFIFLTALAGDDTRRQAMELGADGYVVKPFHVDQFLHLIQEQLQKRSEAGKKTGSMMANVS